MFCKLRDHFTRVNALNGHVFGNKCLRSFGPCKHLMQINNWWLNSFVMGFMWRQFWMKWASMGKESNTYCTGHTVDFLHIFADIIDKSTKTIPFRFQEIFVTLTHWGPVTHICVSKLTIIGSDNGLSPCRRQAIIWTNAGILLIRPLGTNFSEILIEINTFSFKKIHLKMSSGNGDHFVSASMSSGLNIMSPLYTSCRFHFHATVVQEVNLCQTGDKLLPEPVRRCHITSLGLQWVNSLAPGRFQFNSR